MSVQWVQTQFDNSVLGDGVTNPLSFTFTNTFTKGNTIVGFCFIEPAGNTVSSVTDDQNNTYTILDTLLNNSFNTTTFTAVNIQNVPTTLKITFGSVPGAADHEFVCLDELSGASKTDGHTAQVAASSTSVSSGNITTTQTDLLWGAALPDGPAPTVSAGSGFTLRINDTTNELFTETEANVTAGSVAATFTFGTADASDVFLVAFAPFIFGPTDPAQFPVRSRQDYRMLAASSKVDEQWPFTAVKTPTQKGFDWDPQFPERTWHRFRDADEHWPFTATLTPSQMGWEWRPEFARTRFRPSRSADEEYPFTAVPTPTQFGWDNPEHFPLRIRPIPRSNFDEHWPFTAVPTPGQFGWQLDPSFPQRIRFRNFPPINENWPSTGTPTPTQFGWHDYEKFPLRIRFRPILSSDEQYPFTATVTPTQFGWQIEPFFPSRLRFRPLVPPPDTLFPIVGTSTPTNIDFAYPPEFYTERRKYQPLIYEFWQPDIPQVLPQVMTGLAVKTKARTGATYITVTLQGSGIFSFTSVFGPTIFNEVLPFGSAHIVLTSGTQPQSIALGVSNDGVNYVQLGPSITTFPNMINLTASPTLNTPNLSPFKYHAWLVTGGDATTLFTITELLVGWRA